MRKIPGAGGEQSMTYRFGSVRVWTPIGAMALACTLVAGSAAAQGRSAWPIVDNSDYRSSPASRSTRS